jgi:hypothetical protein
MEGKKVHPNLNEYVRKSNLYTIADRLERKIRLLILTKIHPNLARKSPNLYCFSINTVYSTIKEEINSFDPSALIITVMQNKIQGPLKKIGFLKLNI